MQTNKETHEEMIGVLTAMSIVSKRLAKRLLELEKGEEENEISIKDNEVKDRR